MSKLLLLFILIGFSGCSTTSTFSIKTEPPQAEIYYLANDDSPKKSLGKSPISIPMEELKSTIKEIEAGEFFKLSIEKEGFISQTYAIPATQFGTTIAEIDVKLKQGENENQKKLAKEILDQLFLAQKFALAQEFERAQIEIDKILKQFPEFSNALSMRAAIYFAQKNYSESTKWYELAIKSDPKMDEAVKMLAKIKSITSGARQPSDEKSKTGQNK